MLIEKIKMLFDSRYSKLMKKLAEFTSKRRLYINKKSKKKLSSGQINRFMSTMIESGNFNPRCSFLMLCKNEMLKLS
jgi:hypothetical protein